MLWWSGVKFKFFTTGGDFCLFHSYFTPSTISSDLLCYVSLTPQVMLSSHQRKYTKSAKLFCPSPVKLLCILSPQCWPPFPVVSLQQRGSLSPLPFPSCCPKAPCLFFSPLQPFTVQWYLVNATISCQEGATNVWGKMSLFSCRNVIIPWCYHYYISDAVYFRTFIDFLRPWKSCVSVNFFSI